MITGRLRLSLKIHLLKNSNRLNQKNREEIWINLELVFVKQQCIPRNILNIYRNRRMTYFINQSRETYRIQREDMKINYYWMFSKLNQRNGQLFITSITQSMRMWFFLKQFSIILNIIINYRNWHSMQSREITQQCRKYQISRKWLKRRILSQCQYTENLNPLSDI